MNSNQLTTHLHELSRKPEGGAPRRDWVSKNRELLLMQVRNTTNQEHTPGWLDVVTQWFAVFVPTESVLMGARALGVFMLVFGTVALGGLASARAYRDAMPGDLFYKTKLAIEKVQFALAPTDEYKVQLHVEYADRRIEELARLADMSFSRQAYIPAALDEFNAEVSQVNDLLNRLRTTDPAGVSTVANLVARKMETYKSVLRKARPTLAPEASLAVAKSRSIVEQATIRAMAVIVEKNLDGNVSPNLVANRLDDNLNEAEANIASVIPKGDAAADAKTAKARAAIAEAKKLVTEEKYQAALLKIQEVATLTDEADTANQTAPATAAQPKTATGTTSDSAGAAAAATTTTKTDATAPASSGSTSTSAKTGADAGSGTH